MKKFGLLLTLLLIMSFAVGCGGNDVKDESEEVTTTQEDTTTEETTTEEATTTGEKKEETTEAVVSEETSDSVDTEGATSEAETEAVTEASPEPAEEATEASNGGSGESPYIVASEASEEDVEAFAEKVKTAIVNSSWSDLGDMINYPITVGGTEVADKDAFVSKMNESTVSSTFVDAVSNADCSELFANGQGIMIGNGEVWFLDYAYDAVELTENGDPDFKIITLNGIVE